ncbi:MAG: PHP domain-containing protein [Gemmatimonadota bacterium]
MSDRDSGSPMDPDRRAPMWRVDLHSHTYESPDAGTSPEQLVERALTVGLDRIAVTDHGSIDGALAARELAPERVIIGEEIRCRCGTELIGLFLQESIPMRRCLEEVVERIRDQGGVIYAPHPYAYPWRPMWRARRALEVSDLVEAVNARAFFPPWNRAAGRGGSRRKLPLAAGSDAHFPGEIGRAFTRMPAFCDPGSFLAAVGAARPVWVATTGPGAHVRSTGLKMARSASALANRLRPYPQPQPAEP